MAIDERPDLEREAPIVPGRIDWYDESTRLPGPAFWQAVLVAESARCLRYRRPATLVLARVVGYAELIELWGTGVAAQAVIDVAGVLRAGCRASDHVARLGDDLVGLLLTETDEVAAINFLERVRERSDRVLGARAPGVRIAFGWAGPTRQRTLVESVTTAEDVLAREVGSG